jgi:hypothetical protein
VRGLAAALETLARGGQLGEAQAQFAQFELALDDALAGLRGSGAASTIL